MKSCRKSAMGDTTRVSIRVSPEVANEENLMNSTDPRYVLFQSELARK